MATQKEKPVKSEARQRVDAWKAAGRKCALCGNEVLYREVARIDKGQPVCQACDSGKPIASTAKQSAQPSAARQRVDAWKAAGRKCALCGSEIFYREVARLDKGKPICTACANAK